MGLGSRGMPCRKNLLPARVDNVGLRVKKEAHPRARLLEGREQNLFLFTRFQYHHYGIVV